MRHAAKKRKSDEVGFCKCTDAYGEDFLVLMED